MCLNLCCCDCVCNYETKNVLIIKFNYFNGSIADLKVYLVVAGGGGSGDLRKAIS